jgi:hypothetical protein
MTPAGKDGRSVNSKLVFVTAVALVAAAPPVAGPPLPAELSRVRAQINAKVPAGEHARLLQRLDRADAALAAGRTYQALYLFEAAYEGAGAFAYAASSGLTSPGAFLKTWTAVGAPKPRGADARRFPAVVAAVADIAEDRAPATYQASRPYSEDAGISAGLYYLGESRAQLAFATFVRSGSWPALPRRLAFHSIAPALTALDRDMVTTYEAMDPADHRTYILASSALKQARSLNEHGKFEGALLEYLLSRYLFAPLRGPAAAEPTAARIDAARAALPTGEDHSIAEFFLQLAEEGVAGSAADLRRGASAVLDDVLPAYFAAIATAHTTTTDADANATATITLVRWPFT